MVHDELGLKRCRRLLRLSLATLPFGFYLNLVGILAVLVVLRRQVRLAGLDPLTRNSLVVVSAGMILSTVTAIDRGEATLQLTNFLPFFWLFATLPIMMRSPHYQVLLARDLVLASIPINLVAIVEYAAKNNYLPAFFSPIGLVQSWQNAPHIGRAMVMFDHPNTLANYLTISLGLGLGLMIWWLRSPLTNDHPTISLVPHWLWGATLLNLVGIFCSGSRNGILIAVSQLLVLVIMVQGNRLVLMLGGLSIAALGIAVVALGLGHRTIGIAQVMDDPRVGVWKIALDLIAARPWLGWGLGSFKFLYPARLIDPGYPAVFHTHNLWLLLAAECGIPVMLALTITIGFICYRGSRAVWQPNSPVPAAAPVPLSGQREQENGSDRLIFSGYALAFGGSMGFSLLDVTLYDARLNVMNWVLLATIYAWTLKPPKQSHLNCTE